MNIGNYGQLGLMAAVLLSLATWGNAELGKDSKEWPQFHGPNRDNISRETGLLKQWPRGGPALAWKTTGIGEGYSSVAVAGGRIYTAGEEGDSSFVIALNETDGKPVWKTPLGATGGGGGYPGPRATPTVDGELVFTIGQHGDILCCHASEGKEIWRTNLNRDHGGKMMSGWGNSESLVIDGNLLLCTPGGSKGTVMALDKKTGKQVWRCTELTDDAAYMSPVVADIGKIRQAVVFTSRSVAGIAVADGKLLWQAERPGKVAVIPTPVIKDNLIYVTSGYGIGCDLFRVTGGPGKFSAEKVYSNKTIANHHGGVILLNGIVFGHSDRDGWVAQDLQTGQVKFADKKILGKGTISYADGRFYLRDEKTGTIVLAEPSAGGFREHGRLEQPDRSKKNAWPHMVIANGRLYVRDQDVLLCYKVK